MKIEFFKKIEYSHLDKLYKKSPRSPLQINAFNMADVEIIQTKKDHFLACSTDSIAVEIHSGLYKNPDTWAHLAIANSVSDLAASGCKPIGMLISAQWKDSHNKKIKPLVYKAMSKSLQRFQVPLLGGDSGSSNETVLTTTIIGESQVKPLTRQGVQAGDMILAFGDSLGYGPQLSYDFLHSAGKNQTSEKLFRPYPRWQTILKFRSYFKASIDSSDGLYNALDTLAEINAVRFKVNLTKIKLPKSIMTFQIKNTIPLEFFIECDLGDLQTCVAISKKKYTQIKNKLPYHQIIAEAESKISNKESIYYDNSATTGRYRFLPQILETTKLNYSLSLKLWLKQFTPDKPKSARVY